MHYGLLPDNAACLLFNALIVNCSGWLGGERGGGSVRDTEKSKLVVVWFERVYIVYNKVQTFVLLWALPVCGYCGP